MRAPVLLLAGLLLAACRQPEEPPHAGSEGSAMQQPAAASKPPTAKMAPPPVKFARADDAVGYALFRARYEAYRTTASHLSRNEASLSAYRGLSPVAGARRIQVVSSGNLRGRLEDCGCKSNPLGGLARRMTLLRQPVEGDAVALQLQLDAGDALFSSTNPAGPGARDGADALLARTLLASYGALGVQAMALGAYDLRLGASWAIDEARRAGVAALSANLRLGTGWAPGSRVLGSGPDTVGVVAVTLPTDETAGVLQAAGVDAEAAQERYAVEAARVTAAGAKALILLVAGGTEPARTFVAGLQAARLPLPALVLSSGSLTLTGDPLWAGTTPVLEAGDEGKTLLRTDLFVTGEQWQPAPEGGALLDGVRRYMTLIRSHQNAQLALLSGRSPRGQGDLGANAEAVLREADALSRELAAGAGATGPQRHGSVLRNRVVPISPNTAEDAAMKQRIDDAKLAVERSERGNASVKNGKTR